MNRRQCLALALAIGVTAVAAWWAAHPSGPMPFGSQRSGQWAKVRADFLAEHPTCAACGGKESLEVHHVLPVHVAPGLELFAGNLLTLCTKPGRECHFRYGHCLDWKAYNPNVRADAARELARLKAKRYE